ncbi:MAG TPA: SAM-dependent methyltransferase [Alphaproteobacteria bacterium]|nr:SAM-dependent methyltransferase [Alphaproteobacteria bacterium]USO06008.1 MAG: SAM-dependent methyltransferase [Rhodospirillales bacterium]HOO82664.1 SAM-dependent methyltransferase [Alphaproteobacteria bacterium]
MPSPLEEIVRQKIRADGPMLIGAFMALALGHPEHGYYMKGDPFGRAGDFVTAPEVSQLFGEMIGVWAADLWMQMGAPERLAMVECGPGRGTLMADILRASRNVAGFHDALRIHLVEMSPVLRGKQREALAEYEVVWHEDFKGVPGDVPMIVIGNEFLDALPFEQYVGDVQRKVGLDEDAQLVFVPMEGDVYEFAPYRNDFVKCVCSRLKAQGGAALFIDYGHVHSGPGDTFQAIKGHEYVDVLSHIGDADLTSHVNFEALQRGVDIGVAGPVEQGDFLRALGIGLRARMLAEKADVQQVDMIEKGLHRLIDSDQMGSLFKVIGFYYHDKPLAPAGF